MQWVDIGGHASLSVCLSVVCLSVRRLQVAVFEITTPNFRFSIASTLGRSICFFAFGKKFKKWKLKLKKRLKIGFFFKQTQFWRRWVTRKIFSWIEKKECFKVPKYFFKLRTLSKLYLKTFFEHWLILVRLRTSHRRSRPLLNSQLF